MPESSTWQPDCRLDSRDRKRVFETVDIENGRDAAWVLLSELGNLDFGADIRVIAIGAPPSELTPLDRVVPARILLADH